MRPGFRRFAATVVAFAASIGTTAALAAATANAYVTDERVPSVIPPAASGAVFASQSGTGADGAYAQATADASAGTLRTVAQAGLNGPYIIPASADASISEAILFSGGFGQTAYLDYSFEGSIALAGAEYPQAAFAQLAINIGTIFGGGTTYETLSAFAGNCGPGCEVGTFTSRTGSIAIPIAEGGANIAMSLLTFATYGNLVDFSNTAAFYLRLPEGVTFTSQSGRFLADATPIFTTAVPEPETYALMLAGLAMIGVVRRRRRGQS
jgi:hypothetical protein